MLIHRLARSLLRSVASSEPGVGTEESVEFAGIGGASC
jgi:hypothetical protein